jgi:hypothetical protein
MKGEKGIGRHIRHNVATPVHPAIHIQPKQNKCDKGMRTTLRYKQVSLERNNAWMARVSS